MKYTLKYIGDKNWFTVPECIRILTKQSNRIKTYIFQLKQSVINYNCWYLYAQYYLNYYNY